MFIYARCRAGSFANKVGVHTTQYVFVVRIYYIHLQSNLAKYNGINVNYRQPLYVFRFKG